ncbi:MAG: MFS transporter [Planctomycetaceae bacterium]|nr:MFS transporter [Planctomycetaceae bacterium]
MDDAEKHQIGQARGKFIAMAGAYALGAFNDNFFKTIVIMMANRAGRGHYSGLATNFMALPFVIFAAYCGWAADRFPKRRIVIASKIMELAAMCVGAFGIISQNYVLLLVTVFFMGWQSAIFSPALNGSIPELYPPTFVPAANARLKAAITAAILLGVALAGFVLGARADEAPTAGRLSLAAAAVVAVALVGVAASFWTVARPAAAPSAAVPWAGPLATLKDLARLHGDSLLAKVLWADAFIWGLGNLQVLIIMQMGQNQMGLDDTRSGLLALSELVGIAVGGLIAAKVLTGPRWYRALPTAAMVIALLALLIGVLWTPLSAGRVLSQSLQFPVLMGLLALMGIAGGLFMIPCESFIQVRPGAAEKGTVIAASNFMVFAAIMLTGLLHSWLWREITPSGFFAMLGAAAVVAAVILHVLLRYEPPAAWQAQQGPGESA